MTTPISTIEQISCPSAVPTMPFAGSQHHPPPHLKGPSSEGATSNPLHTQASAATESDRFSVHSFLSTSENTAVSDHPQRLSQDKYSGNLDDGTSSLYKALPATPWELLHKGPNSSPYKYGPSTSRYLLTTGHQLAMALGPDNTPHTTEIATIPCAGIRISHGPLTGLLAWRLVVCNPTPIKSPGRSWWGASHSKQHHGKIHHEPSISTPDAVHELGTRHSMFLPASSAITLPIQGATSTHGASDATYNLNYDGPQSSVTLSGLPRHHNAEIRRFRQSSMGEIIIGMSTMVTTNFILDTSLPYSIISRDTLTALGYSSSRLPALDADPHALDYNNTEENKHPDMIVSLVIQGVTTRVRIGRPGEASRLGVQYLRDSGASVFFPQESEGVGPVLYYESAVLFRNVPHTVTPPSAYGKETKLSLPQRVRALFGLSP